MDITLCEGDRVNSYDTLLLYVADADADSDGFVLSDADGFPDAERDALPVPVFETRTGVAPRLSVPDVV